MAQRICILSSVHLVHDVRMFQAEARSLARAGFSVTVIALADDTPSDTDGARVVPLPHVRGVLWRMLATPRFLIRALREPADLYAFHDPELLPVAAALRLLKRRPVVFDVHEDVPASIGNRAYLPRPLRPLVAGLYRLAERLALPFVSGLTLADEAYGRYYRGRHTLVARNYPLTAYADLCRPRQRGPEERPTLIYTGSVTRLRGLLQMLELVDRLRSRFPEILLRIVGPMGSADDAAAASARIVELGLQPHIELTGLVSHAEVHRLIADADVGLALLHPDPNYLRSLPTKLFEYMMMGRPAVVSHFPLWREIVDEARCGGAVNPLDLDQVTDAVGGILADPDEAALMGDRGRRAVLAKYSWEAEARGLVDFYRGLLDR